MPELGILVFIYLDNGIKKPFYTMPLGPNSRDKRYSQHCTELIVINVITMPFQVVEHVKSCNDLYVHIYQLGSKEQVAFKIGCINNIEDNVRGFVKDMLTHIQLFRGISRQGVCSRKVVDIKGISVLFKSALFYVNRNTAVVSNMLERTGCPVENTCLATIWVTYKSNIDSFSLLIGRQLKNIIGYHTVIIIHVKF